MTRLIRSNRISGSGAETRRCAPGTAIAAALAVSFAVLAIGGVSSFAPIGSVFAQTPGTAGPVSLGDLFGPDSVDLKPGPRKYFTDKVREALAAWDALAPGQCPKPKITVTAPKGDELFQRALASAQREVLKRLLGRDADKFLFVERIAGTTGNVEIDASVADTAPPTITVTPPSGTKVKNGQKLTIRVTATEPSTGWQAGMKQIQIEDFDRHTNLAPWDNPAPAPRPCGHTDLTKTIERSYVVPPDVPVAHLKITARDYHNPQQAVLVEYPTGDWYGTYEIGWDDVTMGVTTTLKDTMDIVLNYDGRGNLEGTLVGKRYFKQNSPDCPWETTKPNQLRGKLVGSYTPGAEVMSIQLVEPVVAPTTQKDCPGGGYVYSGDGTAHEDADFKRILGSPRAAGDGTFRSSRVWSEGTTNYNFSLTLRRAQN